MDSANALPCPPASARIAMFSSSVTLNGWFARPLASPTLHRPGGVSGARVKGKRKFHIVLFYLAVFDPFGTPRLFGRPGHFLQVSPELFEFSFPPASRGERILCVPHARLCALPVLAIHLASHKAHALEGDNLPLRPYRCQSLKQLGPPGVCASVAAHEKDGRIDSCSEVNALQVGGYVGKVRHRNRQRFRSRVPSRAGWFATRIEPA